MTGKEAEPVPAALTGILFLDIIIHVKNGKSGVMVQGSDSEIFKECEILHRDDEKVIVKSADSGNRLQDGDKIVLGEK